MSAPQPTVELELDAPGAPGAEVASLTRRVAERLGDRLAAFGIRSSDFRGVLWPGCDLATVTLLDDGTGPSLEAATGQRINPDLYDVDLDDRPEAAALVARLIDVGADRPLFVYRPSWRIEAAAEAAGVALLAAPVRHQRMLEDKRVVESALASRGLPTLGWFDLPGDGANRPGPFVVRSAGQGGGAGMALVEDLVAARAVPGGVSASRFVDDAHSLNLSGCCFADGTVSVHLATVQVIGAASCTSLPFGYCGNDAAGVARVDPAGVRAAEELAASVGRWLHEVHGWRGAYGIDVLVTGDQVRFCELNPRFQGSSRLAAHHAIRQGRPGLFIEHLAAVCGVGLVPTDLLGTDGPADAAQLVVHNLEDRAVAVGRPADLPARWIVELLADPGTLVAPGAPLGRLTTAGSITTESGGLTPDAVEAVRILQQSVLR